MQSKTKMQSFSSANGWYSLEYPRLWEYEVVENIPAFFDPLFGKGALQVFAAKIGSQQNLNEEASQFPFLLGETLADKMALFLDQQQVTYDRESISEFSLGENRMVPHEYYIGDHFYMACMLQRDNTFILALYNSTEAPEEDDARIISEIVRSIIIN